MTVLHDEGYRAALMAKLFEEATELREASGDEVVGEIADVYEVLRALAAVNGHDWEAIEKTAGLKHERGGFQDRLYLV